MALYAGQGVGGVTDVPPAGAVVAALADGAEAAIDRLDGLRGG